MRERLQCAAVGFGLTPHALGLTGYALGVFVLRHLCPLAYPLALFEQVLKRQLPRADVIQPGLHDDNLDSLNVVQITVCRVCA